MSPHIGETEKGVTVEKVIEVSVELVAEKVVEESKISKGKKDASRHKNEKKYTHDYIVEQRQKTLEVLTGQSAEMVRKFSEIDEPVDKVEPKKREPANRKLIVAELSLTLAMESSSASDNAPRINDTKAKIRSGFLKPGEKRVDLHENLMVEENADLNAMQKTYKNVGGLEYHPDKVASKDKEV